MKKILIAIVGVVILGAALLTGCNSDGTVLPGENLNVSINSQQQGIWVNGEGKVMVTPDVAILSLGVRTQKDTVAEARDEAAAAMEQVIQTLKDSGIEDKDIQTQYFNISQIWDSLYEGEKVTGYQVTNTVTVKVREIEATADIIDAAVLVGGDSIRFNSLSFTVDEPREYYEKAREEAMEYAAAKATQLADEAGVILGKVTYISESSSYYGPIYRNYVLAEDAMAIPVPSVGTNISIGELEITANVQVAYEID